MMRRVLLALVMAISLAGAARAGEPQVYYFGATGCEFCANGLSFFRHLEAGDKSIHLTVLDIIADENDAGVFVALTRAIGLTSPQVPMTVIGNHIIIGFESEATTGAEIAETIETCRRTSCPDVVRGFLGRSGAEMVMTDAPWVVNRRFANAAWSPSRPSR